MLTHRSLRPEAGLIEMNGGTEEKDGEEEREEETRFFSYTNVDICLDCFILFLQLIKYGTYDIHFHIFQSC